MDGCRIDVDVSDPFLFSLLNKNDLDQTMTIERKTCRTILIGIEFTVNGFHLLRSLDGIESAQFVSHSLQIFTRGWSDSQFCVFHHFDWRRQFSGRVTDTNVAILKQLEIITTFGQIDWAELHRFGHEFLSVPLDVVSTFL
jgi:hypothetical protein